MRITKTLPFWDPPMLEPWTNLAAFVDRALSAEEERALQAHMADCPRCVEFLESYRGTSRVIREATKVDVPADIEERIIGFLASRRD
jgi:anti-sigma factor RsiW